MTASARPSSLVRAFAAASLVALLAGCAQFGASSDKPSIGVPTAAPRVVGAETPARREHQRILAAYGGAYSDPKIEAMLADLSAKLAKTSDRPDLSYRVTVLNSPSVNAFALPSGDLYVTRGLLALANDTAEVAAVLAHEIGHVTARHAFERADRERQAILVSRVMTDVLHDPEAGAMSLAKSRVALARFSRDQELEADKIGVRTIARAGFDAYGSARFLNSMARNAQLKTSATAKGGENEAIDFMSSHPSTPERVQLAIQAAREIGAPGQGERDRQAYLKAVEGMVYGDDPSQGYVRANRFIHPLLGFFFEAPAGFNLENTSEAIVGIGQDGTALRFDAVRLTGEKSLADHLKSDLMDGVQVTSVENVDVNGFPAAIAVAKGKDWSFRLAAIRYGSEVYRLVYAAKELTPQADATFMSSIRSFRRLTAQEMTEVRPQRLAVVTVGRDDTVESIASRMAVTDRQLERFLVLNGMSVNDRLEAGARVKLIVE